MAKTLVVVESPAKAKTIARYLGKDYIVRASVGHIRDLPASTLGVDVNKGFKPLYLTLPGKDKVVRELKSAAAEADRILLATDPDREGEAIAWHLAYLLNVDAKSPSRIVFHEITEKAVSQAVSSPRPVNEHLVNAQQSRRILDRLVGYELSPFLWQKIRKGLSAGRVQSVATRLIVLREREIQAFIPEEYWRIRAFLSKKEADLPFAALYHGRKQGGRVSRVTIRSKEELDLLLAEIKGGAFLVDDVKKGSRKRRPFAPFTTSTLQQSASRAMGFTAKRTMMAAQNLYEGIVLGDLGQTALVTYIRTDSVRVSQEAVSAARDLILKDFGPDYLPAKAPFYRNKSKSQDAHEAIRPSHFDLPPSRVKAYLSNDQFRIYQLIWNRFLASQMESAVYNKVSVDILSGVQLFRAQGEKVAFPGWLALYGVTDSAEGESVKEDAAGDEETELVDVPELTKGETLHLHRIDPEQKFTQPPARYTEASLIKEMEELGIGRPSTYAPTLSTLFERQYVEREGRQLKPTELGMTVTGMLETHFRTIVDTDFTAQMENELDAVESGSRDWVQLLEDFYKPFHKGVEEAMTKAEKIVIEDIPTGRQCPECQKGDLVIREGRYGKFIACSRYPDCKYTETISEATSSHCPKCGSPIRSRKIRRGNLFYFCDQTKDPDCDFAGYDLPIDGKACETCGSYMVKKRFRGRSYERCSNKDCPTQKKTAKKTEA